MRTIYIMRILYIQFQSENSKIIFLHVCVCMCAEDLKESLDIYHLWIYNISDSDVKKISGK